jgi:N-acetylneuraminic acid mutarotase
MSLTGLPEELALSIFSHLSERDWCSLACVSRALYRIANDGVLWNRRITTYPVSATTPPPRVCHTSWIYKNKLYIYGGHCPLTGSNFISDVKSDLFCFDLETKKWTGLKCANPFPLRTEHTATLANNRVFISGGYSGGNGGYKMEIHSFKFEGDEVSTELHDFRGDAPNPRSAHTCVFWKNSLFIFGGWNGVSTNDDFFKLNLKKMKWKRVKDFGIRPSARRSHGAVVVGNSMYLFGGFTGEENCFPHLHRYDFLSKKWSIEEVKGLRIPQGRSRARLVSFHNTLGVSGGWDRTNHFQDWWEFDLVNKEWRAYVLDSPSPLGQHTVELALNKAYVFGGYHSSSQAASDSLWCYSLGHLGRPMVEA